METIPIRNIWTNAVMLKEQLINKLILFFNCYIYKKNSNDL